MTLRTSDGRLDEATDVQMKMLSEQVQFEMVLPASALHGTLVASGGTYNRRGAPSGDGGSGK